MTVISRNNLLAINSEYFSATSEKDLKISNQKE